VIARTISALQFIPVVDHLLGSLSSHASTEVPVRRSDDISELLVSDSSWVLNFRAINFDIDVLSSGQNVAGERRDPRPTNL
jgi:hypothetical protein